MKIEYNWPHFWLAEDKKRATEYMDRLIDKGLQDMYALYEPDYDISTDLETLEKNKVIQIYNEEDPHV